MSDERIERKIEHLTAILRAARSSLDDAERELANLAGATWDALDAAALAEQGETETIERLRGQIGEARSAWWSATEPGDSGLIYTDRIEDAMDDIWGAIGHADWSPVPNTTKDES